MSFSLDKYNFYAAAGSGIALALSHQYIGMKNGLDSYTLAGGAAIGAVSMLQEYLPVGIKNFLKDNVSYWEESTILVGLIGALAYDLSIDGSIGGNDLSLPGAGRYFVGAVSAVAGVQLGNWIKNKVSPPAAAAK